MSFLRNTWYVAAHAYELDEGLVSRTICNEQVVMFRTESGGIAVLEDRCPHRFVPLSMGKRVGDTVQCGYHGLRFDASGACVEAPNDDDSQRTRACVRSYAAVEQDAVIWIWMGEAEQANAAEIPAFTFLSDKKKYTSCQGYSHIKSNYQMIVDNLLDLSHIHYLHPTVHEGSNFADFTNELQVKGDEIWSMLWRHHYHLDPVRQKMFGFASDDVEGQGHSRWNAPGVLLVETALWDHGKSIADGVETPSAHLLTPETEFTTHYFWASGRTYELENTAMTEITAKLMRTVFETQDGPMCEAQQRAMGERTDFLDFHPLILRADAAGVAARRLMRRKLKAEWDAGALSTVAAE